LIDRAWAHIRVFGRRLGTLALLDIRAVGFADSGCQRKVLSGLLDIRAVGFAGIAAAELFSTKKQSKQCGCRAMH